MDAALKGQVVGTAAEVYDEFFVPALFREWAAPVCDAAGLAPGRRVLDVACGTGVLARAALARVQPGGTVVGLDCNADMLDVARRSEPEIEWKLGQAEALPIPGATLDAVISQFGLMFFEDRIKALQEMWRVLRRGGRLAVAVWGPVEEAPGYAAMVALLQRLFGTRAAEALRAPYSLGDPQTLGSLVEAAGILEAKITTRQGRAEFPSIESWVHTDVKGWTLADMIDEAQYQSLQRAAQRELTAFAHADGRVRFAHPAHIVTAVKK